MRCHHREGNEARCEQKHKPNGQVIHQICVRHILPLFRRPKLTLISVQSSIGRNILAINPTIVKYRFSLNSRRISVNSALVQGDWRPALQRVLIKIFQVQSAIV